MEKMASRHKAINAVILSWLGAEAYASMAEEQQEKPEPRYANESRKKLAWERWTDALHPNRAESGSLAIFLLISRHQTSHRDGDVEHAGNCLKRCNQDAASLRILLPIGSRLSSPRPFGFVSLLAAGYKRFVYAKSKPVTTHNLLKTKGLTSAVTSEFSPIFEIGTEQLSRARLRVSRGLVRVPLDRALFSENMAFLRYFGHPPK